MFVTLKIIHMFCLFAGGAASIGNMALIKRVAASGTAPTPMVREVMGVLGKMGFWAIVLLWITGLGMISITAGTLAVGWAFYAKLLAATVALGASSFLAWMRKQAAAGGTPPAIARVRTWVLTGLIAVSLAIVFAVIAFN